VGDLAGWPMTRQSDGHGLRVRGAIPLAEAAGIFVSQAPRCAESIVVRNDEPGFVGALDVACFGGN